MRSTLVAAAIAAAASVTPALGQDAPDWNRSVEAIAVLPSGTSFFDIFAVINVDASDLSATVDLSMNALVHINGTVIDTQLVSVAAHPSTATDCTGLDCGGQPCLCTGSPTICECGPTTITVQATATSLQPGDEIMVLLMRAAGAPADPDTSDDTLAIGFNGDAIFWQRLISSVQIVPSAGTDSFFDISTTLCERARYNGSLDLSSSLELWIDGVEHASQPIALDTLWNECPPATCMGDCVAGLDGTEIGECQDTIDQGCVCQVNPIQHVFPNIPLDPDDGLSVKLVPVPGALPELPGFPDPEEELPVCPWDCGGDANFIVDTVDFLALLAAWGPNPGHPCDFNGDDVVDTQDFLELLAHWGPCFPV